MAVTVTKTSTQGGTSRVWGAQRVVTADVTFDSTYPDNGEVLLPATLGLTKVTQVVGSIAVKSDGSDALVVAYDYANSKLLVFAGTGTAQNSLPENTTADISAYSARLTFIGY